MDAFEAIGETHRRRIVELVGGGERSAGQIAAEFDISRPAVSQHIGVLVDAGVLRVRRCGRQRLYSVDPAALGVVANWLDEQRARWARSLDALERAMDDEGET